MPIDCIVCKERIVLVQIYWIMTVCERNLEVKGLAKTLNARVKLMVVKQALCIIDKKEF